MGRGQSCCCETENLPPPSDPPSSLDLSDTTVPCDEREARFHGYSSLFVSACSWNNLPSALLLLCRQMFPDVGTRQRQQWRASERQGQFSSRPAGGSVAAELAHINTARSVNTTRRSARLFTIRILTATFRPVQSNQSGHLCSQKRHFNAESALFKICCRVLDFVRCLTTVGPVLSLQRN